MIRKVTFFSLVAALLVPVILLIGCSSGPVTQQQMVAVVQRGDLELTVTADGNIEMPDAVNLFFDTTMFTPPYSARIKHIYVNKGDMVKAGTLLAKLDDTTQKMAVEAAQYALELAINNVVQTVCCGVNRSPSFYCDAVALLRFESAQKEMDKAQSLLLSGSYEDAAAQMALANYDIDGAKTFYSDPEYLKIRPDLSEIDRSITTSEDVAAAIQDLSAELDSLAAIRQQVKVGQYTDAADAIHKLLDDMYGAHTTLKRITHLPGDYTYPDTCTSYTVVNEVISSLDRLNEIISQKDFDAVKYAETLSLARHDLELTNKILDEDVSTFRQGLNLKVLRDYNINIQTAIINLQRTKQALLKTELLAPFDGSIVDINLHDGDMITQRYSVNGIPIDSYVLRMADTKTIKMSGTVDQVGVMKVAKGQKAKIYVDAVPGRVFSGVVTYVSPYGPLQANGVQAFGTAQPTVPIYSIEIALDPQEASGLAGGLTTTAEIICDQRSGVLIVPNSAIRGNVGAYTVNVLKDEKTVMVEQRPVQIGLQTGTHSEIISGLNAGDMVLLENTGAPAKPLHR